MKLRKKSGPDSNWYLANLYLPDFEKIEDSNPMLPITPPDYFISPKQSQTYPHFGKMRLMQHVVLSPIQFSNLYPTNLESHTGHR